MVGEWANGQLGKGCLPRSPAEKSGDEMDEWLVDREKIIIIIIIMRDG